MQSETYFDVLGIPQDSGVKEIREGYDLQKARNKKNPERLMKIDEAFLYLMNPDNRQQYLEQLGLAQPPAAPNSAQGEPNSLNQNQNFSRSKTDVIRPAQENSLPHKTEAPAKRRGTDVIIPGVAQTATPLNKPGTNQPVPRQKTITNIPNLVQPTHHEGNHERPRTMVITPAPEPAEGAPVISPPPTETHGPTHYALLVSGRGQSGEIPLILGENIIGRPSSQTANLHVPLDDPERFISRRHARLEVRLDGCFLQDLGSGNGTLLNGEKITPCALVEIHPGAKIKIEMYLLTLIQK